VYKADEMNGNSDFNDSALNSAIRPNRYFSLS